MPQKLPTFLIVGAAKSGTSSLWQYLKQHPDVYIPAKKECRFFSEMSEYNKGPKGNMKWDDTVPTNLREYQSFFLSATNKKAVGEASPDYLYYYKNSAVNIKRYLGDNIKIIIILRNPIDRAYSHYLHYVRDGQETLSFEEAIHQEDSRIREKWEFGWHYKSVGLYYKQVKAYLDNFKSVKIFLFEDLENDPLGLVKSIFDYLQIDRYFDPDIDIKYNVSGIPKNNFLGYLVFKDNILKAVLKTVLTPFLSEQKRMNFRQIITKKILKKPSMESGTKRYLQSFFRDDIILLQNLINRDLSGWLR